jgi:hypothetical protein
MHDLKQDAVPAVTIDPPPPPPFILLLAFALPEAQPAHHCKESGKVIDDGKIYSATWRNSSTKHVDNIGAHIGETPNTYTLTNGTKRRINTGSTHGIPAAFAAKLTQPSPSRTTTDPHRRSLVKRLQCCTVSKLHVKSDITSLLSCEDCPCAGREM